MTEDLREQLARRLIAIYWNERGEPWRDDLPPSAGALAVADEVIRQMEWTRERGWISGPDGRRTLAPDDWRPE